MFALANGVVGPRMPAEIEAMTRKRDTGREAPMVITPREVARLLRQIVTIVRGRKR
jgi:hypothetical protein